MADRRPDRILGPGHDEFWAWCTKGELRLQRDATSGTWAWPPNERHAPGDGALEWVRMSGRGTVLSWCTFERDYYAGLFPIPWDTILVALEEGPLFLSNPLGFTFAEIEIGMPVSLAFIDCEDGAGAFRLPVFKKAGA